MARDTPKAPPAFPSIPIGAAIDANEVSREEVVDLFGKERAEQMTREIPAHLATPPTTPPISQAPPAAINVPDPNQMPTSNTARIVVALGCLTLMAGGVFLGMIVLGGALYALLFAM